MRHRLGIPGLIAIIALVFAMGGAAYAAKKYVITSTKQIKPSVLKQLKGKQGPQGPAGTNGTNGKDGTNGTNGTNGAAGKSVVTATLAPGEGGCTEGGVSVEVEAAGSPKAVCNGEEGSPWTAGGVLPSGATERGTWAGDGDNRLTYTLNEETEELEEQPINTFTFIPISFALPVAPAPTEVVYSKQLEEEAELGEPVAPVAGCPGLDGEGLPLADAGVLCVYQMSASTPAGPTFFAGTKIFPSEQGADSMGTIAGFTCSAHNCRWMGVWAVTAP
ncbi:MAG TPA: hypothetical protein VFI17_05380 [Solirubrobacterales bacterium]|nr:hypothetical protein [Solirubrobacterales bacterium]